MKLPWMSRADRRRWKSARTLADPEHGPSVRLRETPQQVVDRPVPPPPAPAPKILCRECGCTYREACGDGCYGVQDQADGRCEACIDPSVIIDWSKEIDDSPRECVLCGAPFYAARRYCSDACEIADGDDDDDQDLPVPATARPYR